MLSICVGYSTVGSHSFEFEEKFPLQGPGAFNALGIASHIASYLKANRSYIADVALVRPSGRIVFKIVGQYEGAFHSANNIAYDISRVLKGHRV